MHELGIVFNIVDKIERLSKEYNLTKVASITLQIGEFSSVVPHYIEECYPAAVDKSELLHDTELKIEIIPANLKCRDCGQVFDFDNNHIKKEIICPSCGCKKSELLSGREFLIKEIEAY